jgi:hypothetical protein
MKKKIAPPKVKKLPIVLTKPIPPVKKGIAKKKITSNDNKEMRKAVFVTYVEILKALNIKHTVRKCDCAINPNYCSDDCNGEFIYIDTYPREFGLSPEDFVIIGDKLKKLRDSLPGDVEDKKVSIGHMDFYYVEDWAIYAETKRYPTLEEQSAANRAFGNAQDRYKELKEAYDSPASVAARAAKIKKEEDKINKSIASLKKKQDILIKKFGVIKGKK